MNVHSTYILLLLPYPPLLSYFRYPLTLHYVTSCEFLLSSVNSIITSLCIPLQVETLKRTVDRTASDLERTRVEVTQQKQDIVEKTKKSVHHFLFIFS